MRHQTGQAATQLWQHAIRANAKLLIFSIFLIPACYWPGFLF